MKVLLNQLTSYLLYSNLGFHVRHFNAKTHSIHIVLNDLYELCETFADEIGEQYLALIPESCVEVNFYPKPGLMYELQEVPDIEALETLINNVVAIYTHLEVFKAPPSILNIIEARLSDLNKSLYLLRLAYEV